MINRVHVDTFPLHAAQCRGVYPSESVAWMFAPKKKHFLALLINNKKYTDTLLKEQLDHLGVVVPAGTMQRGVWLKQ